MPSTASTLTRLEEMAAGENSNTWGPKTNTNLNLLEQATHGVNSFTLSGAKTLTTVNYATDEARKMVLNITGGTGGTITVPNLEHVYIVRNGSTGNVILTAGTGAVTATIPTLTRTVCFCDGSDEIYAIDMTDLWVYERLTANFTHATTTHSDSSDWYIPALSMTDGHEYEFEGKFYVKITSGSVIPRWVFAASLTDQLVEMRLNSGTAQTILATSANTADMAAVAVGTAYRPLLITGHMICGPSTNGNSRVMFATASGTPTITVRAGSYLKWRRTYP